MTLIARKSMAVTVALKKLTRKIKGAENFECWKTPESLYLFFSIIFTERC